MEKARTTSSWSLRAKVSVLVAVFSVVGSASAGWAVYRLMEQNAHASSLRHARGVLDALVVPSSTAIAEHDLATLDLLVAAVADRRHPEVTTLAVLDAEGSVLASSGVGWVDTTTTMDLKRSDEPVHRFVPRPYAATHLDLAWPVASEDGHRWGTLVARFSLAESNALLTEAAWATLLTTLGVALLAWAVALLWLNRLVLEPTRKLADMARRLGDGELEVPSEVQSEDEFGQVSGALHATSRRLADYTRSLERAVQERTSELEAANRELQLLATTDGLTGLKNHRAFQEALAFEFKRADRHPRSMALCLIDIDHFKDYNDIHGHPAGDELLRRVGQLLRSHLRSIDIIARYGGEEFAVLMLDAGPEDGLRTAEKVVEMFRNTVFEGEHTQPGGKLTISAGVAASPDQADSPSELVLHADWALYDAKRHGRDKAILFGPDVQPPSSTRDLVHNLHRDSA